jgi:hypothetical protein
MSTIQYSSCRELEKIISMSFIGNYELPILAADNATSGEQADAA